LEVVPLHEINGGSELSQGIVLVKWMRSDGKSHSSLLGWLEIIRETKIWNKGCVWKILTTCFWRGKKSWHTHFPQSLCVEIWWTVQTPSTEDASLP